MKANTLGSLFPLVLVGLILTAGWWVTPAQVAPIPLCLFRYFWHIDCPGCGLTRSFLALSRGHFLEAIRYNAAGPLIYLLFVTYAVDHARKLFKKPSLVFPVWLGKYYGVAVVVVLFGQWFFRLYAQCPLH